MSNPYIGKPWPVSMQEHGWSNDTCTLTAAALGASVVAAILQRDEQMAAHHRDADETAAECEPMTAFYRDGLQQALSVCLDEILRVAERMQTAAEQAATDKRRAAA